MMTDQEKFKKVATILQEYQNNEAIFAVPVIETERQKKIREDLRAVVAIIFRNDLDLTGELSVSELRKLIRKIWKETKPENWK